jgi:hypothetical protein
MADERRRDAVVPEERLFEREDDGQAPHRLELADTPHAPRPHLRRDVVEHGDSGLRGRGCGAQVIAGIVHQDDQIVALGAERLAHAAEQAVMGGDLGQGLDEPDDGERLHAVEHGRARALEQRTAKRFQLDAGQALPQGRRHGGGVRVPRRFARRDVDARRAAHGRAAASGEA